MSRWWWIGTLLVVVAGIAIGATRSREYFGGQPVTTPKVNAALDDIYRTITHREIFADSALLLAADSGRAYVALPSYFDTTAVCELFAWPRQGADLDTGVALVEVHWYLVSNDSVVFYGIRPDDGKRDITADAVWIEYIFFYVRRD